MFNDIKKLFILLNTRQRNNFLKLQFLVILMSVFEIVGVALIAQFMSLVVDMSKIHSNPLTGSLYVLSGLNSSLHFVFSFGIIVLTLLIFSSALSIYTTWKLAIAACKTGTELSNRLYEYYLNQNWLFHSTTSSAQLTRKIANECQRVTIGIIQPLVFINSRVVLIAGISTAIIIYDPTVAIIGLGIFTFAYLIIFRVVRSKLKKNGQNVSSCFELRFRLMNEGFGGIKDILILGRKSDFINRFNDSGNILARSLSLNTSLSLVPRYLVELIAFGSLICLVLYLLKFYSGDTGSILTSLSVYALAAFKILPAFQQLYSQFATIKGNMAAFHSIEKDLFDSVSKNEVGDQLEAVDCSNKIELRNISFTYPNKEIKALDDISLEIKAHSVVGFVGESGSGKSTAVDVLIGLINPDQGQLLIDGKCITSKNASNWSKLIGFVPQSIFLSEGSIAENIAFGVSKEEIDLTAVSRAIRMSHLEEFVSGLDKGVDTLVGERGVQLSGGQRQRVGIARALYHNPPVLVFDEATSALDGITEKIIMRAIHEFHGSKTVIIIAHRLKTVRDCDQIYYFDAGRIIAHGTFEGLKQSDSKFRKMAEYA